MAEAVDGAPKQATAVEGTRIEARLDTNPNRNPLRLPLTALHFNTNAPERHTRLMSLGITKLDQVHALYELGALKDLIGEDWPNQPTVDRLGHVMNVDIHQEDPEGLARIKDEIHKFVALPITDRAKIEIVRQLGYVTPAEFAAITRQQLEFLQWPDPQGRMPFLEFSPEDIDEIMAVAEGLRSPAPIHSAKGDKGI